MPLEKNGVAYVCFEQAKALCERDKKRDDSEFRADASDPGTPVQSLILGGRKPDDNFHRWTTRLQMNHFLHRGLRFISTGEMRKTLLVTAILSEPALLILDSPLDGLDHNSQEEMRNNYRRITAVKSHHSNALSADGGRAHGCDTCTSAQPG